MAASQEFWYEKLKSWVPAWWFSSVDNTTQEAIFQAMAAALREVDLTLDEHFTETFICSATGGYLDEHGSERNVTRNSGELDPQYAQRIKNIVNTTSCSIIKQLVDGLLDVGEATILEDFDAALYFDREDGFYNRGDLYIDPLYNVFSIIVDNQVHAPYSFYDREYFMDREDFLGRNESSLELFQLIVEAVNRSKALGTLYRLVERVD